MKNITNNKIQKYIDLIVIIIIVALIIFFIINKINENIKHDINIKCNELSQKLNDMDLIENEYRVSITPYDKANLRVVVDIYYYKEEMNIDFEYLFNTIYKKVSNASFKDMKFNNVEIVIFDFTPNNDENGGSGVGITKKIFDL